MSKQLRMAMWSGPRNISTAMMRSWGNRDDTFVCDEPLYAHYLQQTGLDHPGAAEVIEHHDTDWRRVVDWLTGEVPQGKAIFYQKHMAHHLLPCIDRAWLSDLTHCFLIRDPREMLTSLIHNIPNPTVEDTGLPQQLEILSFVREQTGVVPPILDARDVLEHPRDMLKQLTARLGVDFSDKMLSWPAGRRETDGIWAKYWYANVEASTEFQPYRPKTDQVPNHLGDVLEQCVIHYQKLHELRMTPHS